MKQLTPRRKIVFSCFLVFVIIMIILSSMRKEINDRTCNFDEDCVIIAKLDSQNLCCDVCEVEIVNKQTKMKRTEWWVENCKGVECPKYDCYMEKLPDAKCINNLCEIEWIERNTTD